MTYRVLFILSVTFACIPLAGEMFLFISTGTFNSTIFTAIGIAVILTGNLIALKFHKRLLLAQFAFCTFLTIGVTIAIANDGGIQSPLWFFQLLLIFGTGFVFRTKGVLVQGAYTCLIATAYFILPDFSIDKQGIANFTSLLASALVFTVLSYLYEREKDREARATANLVVANDELRQFAYRTSHDLKAPLVSIRNLTDMLREDIDSGDLQEAKQITTRIISRADSLERLIVDILNLAKTDIKDEAAESIDLASIVEEITDRLSFVDVDSSVNVQFTFAFSHTGQIKLPRARMTQILENLIANAVRYRNPTEEQPFVKVASLDKADRVEVTVEDNGLGISDKYVDHLFQMFQRFHPEAAPGSGLGLYIVKKHVDKLGAHIDYRRTENGSLFTLILNRTMS